MNTSLDAIEKIVKEGDVIFIAIPTSLYRKVAEATGSWVSHVGWVHSHNGKEFLVAESRIPFSTLTPLSEFVARSDQGRVCIRRPNIELSDKDLDALREESNKRLGILYHLGFKYESRRQFCSKFVYDVFHSAIGFEIGKLQTFSQLLQENPNASLWFWRLWYFGRIPWRRVTITPHVQYCCAQLKTVYEC